MLFSMLLLLGLLMIIPSFGVGYLVNSLSRHWWASLPIYSLAAVAVVLLSGHHLSGILWFALIVAYSGGLLSNLTMWQLKRGNYKKFIS